MNDKNIQEVLHDLRKQIDACIKKANDLRQSNSGAGREISLSHTKLQEAKMWIGKALGELGAELPADYPHDNAEPTPDPETKAKKTDEEVEDEQDKDQEIANDQNDEAKAEEKAEDEETGKAEKPEEDITVKE